MDRYTRDMLLLIVALFLGLVISIVVFFRLSDGEVDICQAGPHTGPVSTSLRR